MPSTKEDILAEMDSIMLECSESGWDGYGGNAVTRESFNHAVRFLDLLPDELVPECSPTPCCWGNMGFDWLPERGKTITILFEDDGDIVWGWLIGEKSGSGVLEMENGIPKEIIEKIKEVLDIP